MSRLLSHRQTHKFSSNHHITGGHIMTHFRLLGAIITCMMTISISGCTPDRPLPEGVLRVTIQGMKHLQDGVTTRTHGSDSITVTVTNNVLDARVKWGPPLSFTTLSESVLISSPRSPLGTDQPSMTMSVDTMDRDHDSIPNGLDACPDLAGVQTDNPATNGCPIVIK